MKRKAWRIHLPPSAAAGYLRVLSYRLPHALLAEARRQPRTHAGGGARGAGVQGAGAAAAAAPTSATVAAAAATATVGDSAAAAGSQGPMDLRMLRSTERGAAGVPGLWPPACPRRLLAVRQCQGSLQGCISRLVWSRQQKVCATLRVWVRRPTGGGAAVVGSTCRGLFVHFAFTVARLRLVVPFMPCRSRALCR
jgi:hypothetical protein